MPRVHAIAYACVILAAATGMWAQPSTSTISYQGVLTQNGTSLPDGTYTLTFKLYDAATGGSVIETITVPDVPTSLGRFTALVPVTPSSFNGSDRWWSVTVSGTELLPRQKVTASPYAMTASAVLQPSEATGPRLSQNRLMLGSEVTGESNIIMQIDFANSENARGILQTIKTQGGSWGDLHLNPNGGIVYLWKDCIIGSDTPSNANLRIIANSQSSDIQATRSQGSAWGDIRINPSGGDVSIAPNGTTTVRVLTITGADVAEKFDIAPVAETRSEPKPGMVVSIDPANPGKLMVATAAYDKKVAGVISGANGLSVGAVLGQGNADPLIDGDHPVAMAGRVWVYADDSAGTIAPGDRLTTSGTKPGYAMKVTDDTMAPGSVIGKAMTGVDPETGMALVLVNLQ
jgi:hypothetical protein